MISHNCFYYVLCYFLINFYVDGTEKAFNDQKNIFSVPVFSKFLRAKKNVDLEIYSDVNAARQNNVANTIVHVCGDNTENGIECYCENREITCWKGLKDVNIKPAQENFIIENVLLADSTIEILQKDKIFPQNENTIKELSFHNSGTKKIETSAFDKLTSLTSLSISKSLLNNIDENVLTTQLGTNLLKLDLSINKLNGLHPSAFKNLVNLEKLDLEQNQQDNGKFEKFPKSLSKLKALYLGECALTNLDENVFENLRQLEILRLSGNKFLSVPTAIKFLPRLKEFRFIMTHIKILDKFCFQSNFKLEFLSMSVSYNLKSIEDCTFCNNPNLKVVDFGISSELSFIHENAFGASSNGYAPDIEEFDIEGCNVSVLPEKLLNWKNVQKLAITGTPFACNCSMAWLFKDLLSNNSIYESKLIALTSSLNHHKYNLGCLGPPSTAPNHTHPHTINEIFSSCNVLESSNFMGYFLVFIVCIGFIAFVAVYINRYRIGNFYVQMS